MANPGRCPRIPAALLLLVLLPPPAHASWPHDVLTNVPLITGGGTQTNATAVSDGAGGAYVASNSSFTHVQADGSLYPGFPAGGVNVTTAPVAVTNLRMTSTTYGLVVFVWSDARNGNDDIWGTSYGPDGTPLWDPAGVPVCNLAGGQVNPSICSDGAGGVFVAWEDYRVAANSDIYIQRLEVYGGVTAGWPVAGSPVCLSAGNQVAPLVVFDGVVGCNVAWTDYRLGNGDLFAGRVNSLGAQVWTPNGVGICTAAGLQTVTSLLSDGAGGVYLAWQDLRGADYDIYARGINGLGAPVWTANGVPVCTAVGNQTVPVLTEYDNGVLVAWQDARATPSTIAVQAVTNYGIIPPNFAANGVSVAPSSGAQATPNAIADGVGGVYFTWNENRFGSEDIFVQRFSPAYTVASGWPLSGLRVCGRNATQWGPVAVLSEDESVILAWNDFRSGTDYDIYGQRVDRFGRLGEPQATIVAVKDVPGDQGGRVQVLWTPSYLDASPLYEVDHYVVWRGVSAADAARALQAGARLVPDGAEGRHATAGGERAFRVTRQGAQSVYWEFLAEMIARGLGGYAFTAATLSDSVAAGNPYTSFMIEADAGASIAFWLSSRDSGYSVDNLAPAPASNFTAQYFPGTAPARAAAAASGPFAWLHWGRAPESDAGEYRIHRGTTEGFVPSPGNLVATVADTGYKDLGAPPAYYKLVTIDVHGNASVAATALPANLAGVDGSPVIGEIAFRAPRPNPVRGECVLRLELPFETRVRVRIYDVAGRVVRELADGPAGPGTRELHWDARDPSGARVASGLYFARCEAGGRRLAQRVVLLEP